MRRKLQFEMNAAEWLFGVWEVSFLLKVWVWKLKRGVGWDRYFIEFLKKSRVA